MTRLRASALLLAAALCGGEVGAAVDAPVLEAFFAKDDLDTMIERRLARVLVVYSKTFYFIDKAEQHGVAYDLGIEFEKALNAKLGDNVRPVRVVFLPTSRDRLLPDLEEGRGDIAASNLTITAERAKSVDFSTPIIDHVKEVLVTRKGIAAPRTAEACPE